MGWKSAELFISVVLVLLVAVLCRFELVAAPSGGESSLPGMVYRLDRWTGEVTFMLGAKGGKASGER